MTEHNFKKAMNIRELAGNIFKNILYYNPATKRKPEVKVENIKQDLSTLSMLCNQLRVEIK